VRLFHWHVLTDGVREEERRYEGLGFRLDARHGWIGGEAVAEAPERGWDELEAAGFRHRLTVLERAGVEVVVQPGRVRQPLVDHVGVVGPPADVDAVLARAAAAGLAVRDRGGRRTFVATGAGYRLELRSAAPAPALPVELVLAADDPRAKAAALAALLAVPADGAALVLGTGTLRFVPGGPPGRPRLVSERVGAAA
jgi:hypothetical protein